MDRLGGKKTLKVSGFLDTFEKDDIKKRIDIVSLFEHFGIKLTKKGRNYTGLCPFHEDKTPSLSVDREKGLYNCFGCGESGDHFTIVEKLKGYDFKMSLSFLKEFSKNANTVVLDVPEAEVLENTKPAETGSVKSEKKHPELTLNAVSEYYHKRLLSNKKAVNYLENRGLVSPEIFKRFEIGFSDGSLLKKVSNGQVESLQELGIVRDKGYEHFNNCIVIPVKDEAGTVTEIYGRNTGSTKIGHLYLKGKHKGIFNVKASKVYDRIILTESIIDALSLIHLGIENVQSVYGVNGFTEEHLKLLKENRVRTVVTAFDNDDAGRTASEKLKNRLTGEGFTVKMIFPSHKKDWNEELTDKTLTKEAVKELIENAESFTAPCPEKKNLKAVKDGIKYTFQIGKITYRLLGVKEIFVSNLRVNIKAEMNESVFIDNCDLYSSRSRSSFSINISNLFGLEVQQAENDLLKIVFYLEEERDRYLSGLNDTKEIELTEEEKEAGIKFLKSPNILKEITDDLEILGYVGEEVNKLLMYLAATSRKLDDPISILVLSQSASGKSLLVDAVKRLMPPEDVVSLVSLSDQALNYMPADSLIHKFLTLAESMHSETVEYQIREMLSGHELSRLVTIKDDKTGELVSKRVCKKVIVSAVMSTTSLRINPENASRCFLINADESDEQTHRIHRNQWNKYSFEKQDIKKYMIPEIVRKHVSAQRLLKKVMIVNPYGKYLNFPSSLMRSRRDNERFVDLIATVCFLRQYQKEEKLKQDLHTKEEIRYIECDLEDYEAARRIMCESVLRLMLTELSPSDIKLYESLRDMSKKLSKEAGLETTEVSFTQRDIREYTGYGQSWIKQHLRRLSDFEYIVVVRGRKQGARNTYRLRDDEDIGKPDLSVIPLKSEIERLIKNE